MENNVIWEGIPSGLGSRILSGIGLSSTIYQIVGDELIIKEGFFNRKTKTIKLVNLEEPKLVESLYQRMIKVGTIYLKTIDDGKVIILKNLKDPENSRKILDSLLKNNKQKQLEF